MSIYSGFATRQLEETYDENIGTLIYLLQKRLIKFYQAEPVNQGKFIDLVIKVHTHLKNMEESKYLDPKISQSAAQIVEMLKVKKQELGTQSSKNAHDSTVMEKDGNGEIQRKGTSHTKRSSKSKIILNSLKNQSVEKITATERVGSLTQTKPYIPKPYSQKKRTSASLHQKSFIGPTVRSTSNLKTNEKDKQITPKQKQLITQQPKVFYSSKQDADQSRMNKQENVKKQQSKQDDVRELIKGYLVRRKKQYGKESEWKKQEIREIFHEF